MATSLFAPFWAQKGEEKTYAKLIPENIEMLLS